MPIFTPPSRVDVPPVLPSTPEDQSKPMVFMKTHIPRGANVFILADNTVVEGTPLWDVNQVPNVKYAYYGGRSYNISGEQVTILTAAGYGANITNGVI